MGAPARQFCPLCRRELCVADAVRTHLIADHKRSATEADELIARFDTAQPIPESEPRSHCATGKPDGGERLAGGSAAAREPLGD